ncbi:hypothetical protein DdX_21710 [Ditylenchus destructor]|uniref:Uncharacterized protein n=1 Tax=Ditylenchus destructor TaxID=166010 RepID=A0AAD4MFC3_9BILA|nr:hypothetical protein DdX_21710 [Ditylenchus destructor]
MQPLPMNEFAQQSLKQCYFDVQFDVIEWNTLFTNWRKGAKDPSANGANAVNISFAAMDPFFAMVRFVSTKTVPPVSNNWGYYGNAEVDKLVADARTSFDDKARDAALAKLPHLHRGRRALRVDRARRGPARHLRQGEERGAAQELVHRHRDHDDGMNRAHPQACPLRVAANPLAAGNTSGPAKPVPRCSPKGERLTS